MAVMITAEVPGQTPEGYDGMIGALGGPLRGAKGFIAHWSHPIEGGWRVYEIWATPDDATQWFAQYVHPNLPPGVTPKRSFQELHNVISATV